MICESNFTYNWRIGIIPCLCFMQIHENFNPYVCLIIFIFLKTKLLCCGAYRLNNGPRVNVTLTVTYYHLVFVRTYISICVRSLDVRNKTFKLSCNFLTNWILRSHNIRIVFLKDDTTFYFFKDDDAADTTLSEKYVCLIECLVPTKTKTYQKW